MRVLIAAYACEPFKGSEPLVGWRWALETQRKGHSVWVITRTNNRATIEAYEQEHGSTGIHFEYCDLPKPFPALKKRVPAGMYPYYYAWQILAYFVARRLVRKINFDRIHQLTFVSVRFPTLMTLLGVDSIVGPIGGGERSPVSLRSALGTRFWLSEWLRGLTLWLHRIDPLRAFGLSFATRIYCTTTDSVQMLPWWLRRRAQVLPAIGSEGALESCPRHSSDRIELLYAGLHKDWKGLRLGLRALKKVKNLGEMRFHLTVVGRGPDHQRWRDEVSKLGLEHDVEFIDWLARDELLNLYQSKDAFIFPSMHDSGGLVVLEAMARGLPVVCLDCGGPGVSVDAQSGHCQPVEGLSYDAIIDGLAEGLLALQSQSQREAWSQGARRRADQLKWSELIGTIYPSVDE